MRKNKIYSLLIGLAALIALISCKEEYEPINNRIYISDALTKNVKKVPVNVGEITQTNFTVRIADKEESMGFKRINIIKETEERI